MQYNFRGIISVPAKALKAKKIFVSSLYLLIAILLYNVFTYLALTLDGQQLAPVYSYYGLTPFRLFSFGWFVPAIIFYLGIALSLFSLTVGFMAVTILDVEELRGNLFCSSREALKFSVGRIRQLFLSWLAVALFVGFIVLLGVVIGLITRIPIIGELLYTLFFFFPNFIVAIFTVLIVFVLILSILVMPAAVAADRNGETFNSILGTFVTITRQPVRWLGYSLYSLITAKIAAFIFAYFAYRAVQFMKITTHLGGGDKINGIIASGLAYFPLKGKLVAFTTGLFPGINFGFDFSALSAGGGQYGFASYLMAASLFVIFLTIWGYIVSVVATGQAYAYVIIRKIRDGYTISDEKSLFYEEEWINPPIEEDESKSENNNQQQ